MSKPHVDLIRTIVKSEVDRVTLRTDGFAGDDGLQYAYQELVWDGVK
jgi:hypothetical protein